MAYKHGDRLAICDQCGFKMHLSDLRKQWDGLLACEKCFDEKHPSLTPRCRGERPRIVEGRPEAPDTFVAVNEVTYDP